MLDSPEILTIALAASDEIKNAEITIEHENVSQPSEYPPLKPLETFNRLDGDHVIEKSSKRITHFRYHTGIIMAASIAPSELKIVENETPAVGGDRRQDKIGSIDQKQSKQLPS